VDAINDLIEDSTTPASDINAYIGNLITYYEDEEVRTPLIQIKIPPFDSFTGFDTIYIDDFEKYRISEYIQMEAENERASIKIMVIVSQRGIERFKAVLNMCR